MSIHEHFLKKEVKIQHLKEFHIYIKKKEIQKERGEKKNTK